MKPRKKKRWKTEDKIEQGKKKIPSSLFLHLIKHYTSYYGPGNF